MKRLLDALEQTTEFDNAIMYSHMESCLEPGPVSRTNSHWRKRQCERVGDR